MRKRFMAWLLAVSLLLGCTAEAYAVSPSDFSDMPNDWSRPALTFAVENGLLNGNNGKINPSGTLTRAHMAAILVRAFGAKEQADLSGFSDVSAGAWYYDAMSAAVAMGIFQGSADGKLRPDSPITRQQAFTVLARAFLLENGDPSVLSRFSDGGAVSEVFRTPIASMAAAGYVNGNNGKLNPGSTITRAQFAQVLYNMIARFGIPEQTVKGNVILRENQSLPAGTVIQGDLIVAEGTALENLNLENVTVEGRIVMRSGSEVNLKGETSVGALVLSSKSASVQVTNDSGSETAVTVANGSSVTLTGNYSAVNLNGASSQVYLRNGQAGRLDVRGANARVSLGNAAEVKSLSIRSGADNVTVDAQKGAKIDAVQTAAKDTTVQGRGEVASVDVGSGASGTKVTTNHTDISVDSGAGTVTSNEGTLSGGESGRTDNKGTLKPDSGKPSGGGSSSGSRPSGGSGGSGSVKRDTVTAANGQVIGTFQRGTRLTVDLNGGGNSYTVTVSGSTIIATPAREGCTFDGWTVSGTTLTAKWTKETAPTENILVKDTEGRSIGTFAAGALLTVDPANGTDKAYTVTVAAGTVITVPVREGYTFDRWRLKENTVTAEWIKKPSDMVTVRDSNGDAVGRFENGAVLTVVPDNGEESYTVTAGPNTVIEVPAREGWTFTTWRVSGTTVTAQWQENTKPPVETFTLFDERGVALGTFEKGTELTVDPANGKTPTVFTIKRDTHLEIPKREGYKFDRWRRTGLTITAEWTKLPAEMVDVKDSNQNPVGRFALGAVVTIKPENGQADYTVTIAADTVIQIPVRDGYTFDKWQRNDTVLTAQWKANAPTARDILVKDAAGRTIGTFKEGEKLTVNYDNGRPSPWRSTPSFRCRRRRAIPSRSGPSPARRLPQSGPRTRRSRLP